jgi:spore coat assembly protein
MKYVEEDGVRQGDIVTRKSYGHDLYFKIEEIDTDGWAEMKCLTCRLGVRVRAAGDELRPVEYSELMGLRQKFRREINEKIDARLTARRDALSGFGEAALMPGKVLHIDSDMDYMKLCLEYYSKLSVPARSAICQEKSQPERITDLLEEHLPDILIITGHDSISKKKSENDENRYKSSPYFAEAVRKARRFQPSKDALVIIAGACQSDYESLIGAGANIASSPGRVFIHALDPLFVAEKLSFAPADKFLGIDEIIAGTITGAKGLGGFQTRGTFRVGSVPLRT